MEYAGGTYVSQVSAENPKAACVLWAQNLRVDEVYKFGEKTKSQIVEQMKAEEPTALRGVKNTWFISATLCGGSAYINFVRTVE